MPTPTIRSIHAALAAAVVLAAPLGAPLGAQIAPTPTRITFADAVSLGLTQSVIVRQARNAASLQAATERQQKLQFLPSLSFNVSGANDVGRNFSQAEGTVTNQATQSLSTGISSTATLFDGFRNVASLRQARLGGDATEQDLSRARQTAAFTVASNFLAIVTQQEQLRVQDENLAALVAQEAQIRTLVDAGTRPISDLYQQQASVAASRLAVVDARRALELAKVDLMQTLQLDATTTYDFVPPAIGDLTAHAYDLDSLVARALVRRADLGAQQSRVEAATQGVKAAQAGRLPSVSLTAGYNTGFSTANALGFSQQLDQRRGGSVGIGISIPLFDRGATSLAAERAQIETDDAERTLASQRQDIALQVRRAFLDYQSARERLAAAEVQRKAAEQAATVTQQRYQLGAATLVEVAQARASQVQAASAAVSARYDVVFQQALMSYYTGDLDPTRVSLGV
ncbi:MAG: TolC family protein [Gemmatirosa sp.]|nr:TolC family protein [Gemmatirosa sp.]